MVKMQKKIIQNKWVRLGRHKNRNESGKKVLDSWDRALSMGHVEWSVRVQEKCKKGQCVFGFRATILAPCCWRPYFWCFECSDGSEKLKFVPENQFWSKFSSKTFFFEDWSFFILAAKFCVLHFFRFCLRKLISGYFCSMLYHFFHFLIIFCQKSSPKLTRLGFHTDAKSTTTESDATDWTAGPLQIRKTVHI